MHHKSPLNNREGTKHTHHVEFLPTDIHLLYVKMPSDFLLHKPGAMFFPFSCCYFGLDLNLSLSKTYGFQATLLSGSRNE